MLLIVIFIVLEQIQDLPQRVQTQIGGPEGKPSEFESFLSIFIENGRRPPCLSMPGSASIIVVFFAVAVKLS